MSSRKKDVLWTLVSKLVLPVVAVVISGYVSYGFGHARAAREMAEGLAILDVQGTLGTLDMIVASSETAVTLVAQRAPRQVTEIIQAVRTEFAALNGEIDAVKASESYSIAEINSLASNFGFESDKRHVIDAHVGKPKRTVTCLSPVKPRLATISGLLESLDRQLEQEPAIDLESLRTSLGEIQRVATATRASLDARQSAALQTLAKFGGRAATADVIPLVAMQHGGELKLQVGE